VKSLKRIGWTGVLAVTLSASAQAGTSTGTFTEFEDIAIQQVVNGVNVGDPTDYFRVPTTLSFSVTTDEGYALPNLSVGNSLYSFSVSSFLAFDNLISVIDGVPGQSADVVNWTVDVFPYHQFNLNGGFYLTDPSGEFIGPNGDGSPNDVSIQFAYTYFQVSDLNAPGAPAFEDSGFMVKASVSTVPEPSSIVMAVSAALLILAWPILRARSRTPTSPAGLSPRDRVQFPDDAHRRRPHGR
jgi:hypothetical protein